MRPSLLAAALLAAAAVGLAPPPAQADAALLAQACGGCHAETPAGLSRIAGQRKTPEGWLMTIVRMRQFHGVEIGAADQAVLVAYLADTQGLAPSEAADWRYAMEKDPNAIESIDAPLREMCARCHTGARVMLQRRTPEEWRLHMDFHVGQFPTIEYQALGRDRPWFAIARDEIAPLLAEMLPFETEAWTAWRDAPRTPPVGDWVVLTDLPGKGQAYGRLTVAGAGAPFDMSGALTLASGETLPVSGRMNLYTGYEWRATLSVGGEEYRQVLALSEDGQSLAGRQFQTRHDSLGGRLIGAKADGPAQMLGAVPEAVPAGAASVQVVGVGIDDLTITGADVAARAANPFGAALSLSAAANVLARIEAGGQGASVAFYDSVDRLAVEPAFTIARVGGGSTFGPEAVPAAFRAVGFWNGPDGAPGTQDDIRIGALPATWSVGPSDAIAEEMADAAYAGAIDPAGVFMPSTAGPNPARRFSTNNAGDLKITGAAAGAAAEARLVVTVQRFVDPPIR